MKEKHREQSQFSQFIPHTIVNVWMWDLKNRSYLFTFLSHQHISFGIPTQKIGTLSLKRHSLHLIFLEGLLLTHSPSLISKCMCVCVNSFTNRIFYANFIVGKLFSFPFKLLKPFPQTWLFFFFLLMCMLCIKDIFVKLFMFYIHFELAYLRKAYTPFHYKHLH